MYWLSNCVYVYAPHVPREKGIESPKTGVTDGFELLHGYWELVPSLLEEKPVLLVLKAWHRAFLCIPHCGSIHHLCFEVGSPSEVEAGLDLETLLQLLMQESPHVKVKLNN